MRMKILSRAGILVASALSAFLPGCQKEPRDGQDTRAANERPLSPEEEEANRNKAAIQFIQLQEKDFRTRLETAKEGVAKLGNKTRKRLKPELASLDAKSVRLDSLLRSLPSLAGSELKSSIAAFNATLDSANADLGRVHKSLK